MSSSPPTVRLDGGLAGEQLGVKYELIDHIGVCHLIRWERLEAEEAHICMKHINTYAYTLE